MSESEISRFLMEEMQRLRDAGRDREERLTQLLETHAREIADLQTQLDNFDNWRLGASAVIAGVFLILLF